MFSILLSHVTVAYQGNPVVLDLSAAIRSGQMLALVGPNGAGKTTLMKAMVGLVPLVSGTITFFDTTFEQYRKRIAYVPQRVSVDWDFPAHVIDLVLMGCYHQLGWMSHPGPKHVERALYVLDQVGMADYAHRPIGALSGGQQQRIFLARALMQDADIYLLDEPFIGIDATTETILIALLKTLASQKKTIIVVHHDLQTLQEYFDSALLMNTRCITYGPIQDVLTRHYFVQAYGNSYFKTL